MLIKPLTKGILCGGSVLRTLRISLVFILCLGLAGCRTYIHGIDELKEKAGKEIPVSYSVSSGRLDEARFVTLF